jgi:hypothetical protein
MKIANENRLAQRNLAFYSLPPLPQPIYPRVWQQRVVCRLLQTTSGLLQSFSEDHSPTRRQSLDTGWRNYPRPELHAFIENQFFPWRQVLFQSHPRARPVVQITAVGGSTGGSRRTIIAARFTLEVFALKIVRTMELITILNHCYRPSEIRLRTRPLWPRQGALTAMYSHCWRGHPTGILNRRDGTGTV